MNGLTFLELDYEINILKDSESLSGMLKNAGTKYQPVYVME